MNDPFRVANLLVEHANRVYPGEVAIVAYYGSRARSHASPDSDLDLFYIPVEGKNPDLCRQFILDGLPYDFWPISWQFAGQIANAASDRPWVRSASLIAGAKVLYHRTDEDLARFTALQNRVTELMQPDHADEMLARALNAWRNVTSKLGEARLLMRDTDNGESSHIRAAMLACCLQVVDEVVNCLALASQTHLPQGWAADPARVAQFGVAPPNVTGLILAVAHAHNAPACLGAADALASAARKTLLAAQRRAAKPIPLNEAFLGVYGYAFEYRNKILKWQARGNDTAARYEAAQLQNELARVMSAFADGVNHGGFNTLQDVLPAYENEGLPRQTGFEADQLARWSIQLEESLRGWLQARGVDVGVAQNEEDVLRFLDGTHPMQTSK